jgi:hypothetical protein
MTYAEAWLLVIAGGVTLLLIACALMVYERYRSKSRRSDPHTPNRPKLDDGRIHHAR